MAELFQPLISRDQLLAMYSQYPGVLAAELSWVFTPLKDDVDRIKHNAALSRFMGLFPYDKSETMMLNQVADALLRTARQTGDKPDGKTP